MALLTPEEAQQKREQLVRDGYCCIPGVLPQDLITRWRAYTDELLDQRAVDPKYRYQGSDFHLGAARLEGTPRAAHCIALSPLVDELIDLPAAWEVCRALGFEQQRPDDIVIVLSKPSHGPPLYWHQDMMNWNHPEAAAPWPTRVFLSYYLSDTTRENGCLRVLPGTHRKRIPLHDLLPAAHGPQIQAITDLSHPAFQDHPDAIDLPVKAGDLVINDARVLHAARANQTGARRTLLLQWHSLFPCPQVPSWWRGEIPDVIRHFDPAVGYEGTRIPGKHLL